MHDAELLLDVNRVHLRAHGRVVEVVELILVGGVLTHLILVTAALLLDLHVPVFILLARSGSMNDGVMALISPVTLSVCISDSSWSVRQQ